MPEDELVLGQCPCLVAEEVLNLSEFFDHVEVAHRRMLYIFNLEVRVGHQLVVFNEKGVDKFRHLEDDLDIEGHDAVGHDPE